MRVLLTGGTGYLGGFIARTLRQRGDEITFLARRPPTARENWVPFDLAAPPAGLPGADALVHAAFDHVPGRYRGGEGDDPEGFLARNRHGSLRLVEAAATAGVRRIVFLSTRAVYGGYPPGTRLTEDLPPRPDTLYGQMKLEVEGAVDGAGGVSLRITGVYGQSAPGGWHKWADLFTDFEAGEEIAPRVGTEVHGTDMADAVRTVLDSDAGAFAGRVFNVSDIMLDRHDLLARYADLRGVPNELPPRAPGPGPNRMDCALLRSLGWAPGGTARLEAFLQSLAKA